MSKNNVIFKVEHTDMMGMAYKEEYYDSKNKAKKALRRMLKELMPNIAEPDDCAEVSKYKIYHHRPVNLQGTPSRLTYHLTFSVWHRCSPEYDEYDTYHEGLHIQRIEVQ